MNTFSREDATLLTVDDALVRKLLPTIRRIAEKFGLQRGPVVTDDLVQEGVIGLMQAAATYDEGLGVSLKCYAYPRIKGRMQDHLRSMDHLTRKHRQEMEAGAAEPVSVRSLTVTCGDGNTLDLAEQRGEVDRRFADLDRRDAVAELLGGMGERDRSILASYYLAGQTMREISVALGVSESWISLLLPGALERARERYQNRYGDEAMPTETCRWVKADGSAFVLLEDGRLLQRRGPKGSLLEVGAGMSFDQARAHVDRLDGYKQCGGPASDKPRSTNRRNWRVPPPISDELAPRTEHLPPTELVKRLERLDQHQARVRDDLARIGQLPADFDTRPTPYPYVKPVEPADSATLPGFPWLNGHLQEQPVATDKPKSLPTVLRELGEHCTYEQFCEAIAPRRCTKGHFQSVRWYVYRRPGRQPVEPAPADPPPAASPPPDVVAFVQWTIQQIGVAVLRQTLDQIEAQQLGKETA